MGGTNIFKLNRKVIKKGLFWGHLMRRLNWIFGAIYAIIRRIFDGTLLPSTASNHFSDYSI